jgi:lysine-N-methylase
MKTLHELRKIRLISPNFAKQFKCLGDACPEDCCTGWTVDVDHKTFDFYKRAQHSKLRDRFESMVVAFDPKQKSRSRGTILKASGGTSCCFLEEKLCSIQKTLGSDKLSNTCSSFPRGLIKIEDQVEMFFTLSCPEVARLALLDRNAFEFEENIQSVRTQTIAVIGGSIPSQIRIANRIRIFAINLFKNLERPTWEKLATLGVVCEQISANMKESQLHESNVEAMLTSIDQLIEQGYISRILADAKPQPRLQAEAFALLLDVIPINPFNDAAKQRLDNAKLGLGLKTDDQPICVDLLADRYEAGIRILEQVLSNKKWLLDHAVISDILWNQFPLHHASPYCGYVGITARFGIVRLLLAGTCIHNPNVTADELAQVVQTFTRHYQHNRNFRSSLDGIFERSGWHSLEKQFLFLRASTS